MPLPVAALAVGVGFGLVAGAISRALVGRFYWPFVGVSFALGVVLTFLGVPSQW